MSKQGDLDALLDAVASQQVLLAQFLTALSPQTPEAAAAAQYDSPPNPLHVLRDSATLLKAHTTKLSLLLINKPFTATAVQRILRDISGTCLPAMMSAVEICQPNVWGSFLRHQVVARVRTVMREMDVCYKEVKQIATEELETGAKLKKAKAKANSSGRQEKGRDSLTSTGVVWDACDKLIELESIGIGGLAVKRAEEWRDMIKDAIEELREWEEGDGGDEEDDFQTSDDGKGSDDDEDDGDKDSVEDMFAAANSLPKNRPDLKKQLDLANDKLKKIGMLYAALIKRRLKPFTPSVAGIKKNVTTLDNLITILKLLPESVDDLASSFYELDSEEVEEGMTECIDHARQAVELVKLSWDEQEDEFTSWANKWLEIMK